MRASQTDDLRTAGATSSSYCCPRSSVPISAHARIRPGNILLLLVLPITVSARS